MHLVLTFFDQIKGPSVLMSYPDEKLEPNIINNLVKFFDLKIDETYLRHIQTLL